ncbi:XdhC family protein [Streptomyces fragilis]|uniref:XdhC family protein n=1 Tax=Streptomyces fragilis TaxID=67301 RepID=UPI000D5A1BE8|nr:XdhC/CoxI family protein [Streptomyces fragilis]
MLDIARELNGWIGQGRDFAVATVVAVGGSAPRLPGAALAVDRDGEAVGSVSGGCVEGAVHELCLRALEDGETVRESFGYADADGIAVGLTCGGTVEVLVVPVREGDAVRPVYAAAVAAAARREPAAVARIVEGPAELLGRALLVGADGAVSGGFGRGTELDRTVAEQAAALLDAGRDASLIEIGEQGSRCGAPLSLLVETSATPPRMIVFGAVDFAAALVRAGKFLGFHVTVCDARPVFATVSRFPEADEVVVDWPHRYLENTAVDPRTALCVLTHDPKFDVPLLTAALGLDVAYVGAMGSRRTHLDRLARLREEGVGEQALARLRSPIGLDLGARTPQETALSIVAEIVACRRGGTGVPLRGGELPIHPRPSGPAPG